MGSIPRDSKIKCKTVTWMQCKSLWIKASAKCKCKFHFQPCCTHTRLHLSLRCPYYKKIFSGVRNMFGHGLSDKLTFDLKLSHSCGPLEQSSGVTSSPYEQLVFRHWNGPRQQYVRRRQQPPSRPKLTRQGVRGVSFTPALFNMAKRIQEEWVKKKTLNQ